MAVFDANAEGHIAGAHTAIIGTTMNREQIFTMKSVVTAYTMPYAVKRDYEKAVEAKVEGTVYFMLSGELFRMTKEQAIKWLQAVKENRAVHILDFNAKLLGRPFESGNNVCDWDPAEIQSALDELCIAAANAEEKK